jgi:hypothetical protein
MFATALWLAIGVALIIWGPDWTAVAWFLSRVELR